MKTLIECILCTTANLSFFFHRDQELRFIVHDALDYRQLKVSLFNDDKRSDLIGECWVSLEEVLKHGGGQNDHWHGLTCKGRYAGELRLELTYYDTRPREDKPTEAPGVAADPTPKDARPEGVGRHGRRQPRLRVE